MVGRTVAIKVGSEEATWIAARPKEARGNNIYESSMHSTKDDGDLLRVDAPPKSISAPPTLADAPDLWEMLNVHALLSALRASGSHPAPGHSGSSLMLVWRIALVIRRFLVQPECEHTHHHTFFLLITHTRADMRAFYFFGAGVPLPRLCVEGVWGESFGDAMMNGGT